MAISNKIVSKFAKSVTKKETTKKETIMYGRITSYDKDSDTWFVKLDGSNIETPVANFAASVDKDQRVIVMIKNHSAVVTGNIGSPATSKTYVDNKVYPVIQQEVTVGGLGIQNYYSIEFDEDGKPIYKIIDNTGAEGTATTTYKLSFDDGSDEPVDLADIRALWPNCNYDN